jgi:hypothetical protein
MRGCRLRASEPCAAAVITGLIPHGGIDGSRFTTNGWGEATSVTPTLNPDGSDHPDGRQPHHSVEIVGPGVTGREARTVARLNHGSRSRRPRDG